MNKISSCVERWLALCLVLLSYVPWVSLVVLSVFLVLVPLYYLVRWTGVC